MEAQEAQEAQAEAQEGLVDQEVQAEAVEGPVEEQELQGNPLSQSKFLSSQWCTNHLLHHWDSHHMSSSHPKHSSNTLDLLQRPPRPNQRKNLCTSWLMVLMGQKYTNRRLEP